MDAVYTAVNAAVVVMVGLILGLLGKRRFDAIDRKLDATAQRLDAMAQRFETIDSRGERHQQVLEKRFDFLEKNVERRMDTLQASLDAARFELRKMLLALGIRPAELCPVTLRLARPLSDARSGTDWIPCYPRRRTASGRTWAIRS